jgi:uncharacterized protein
LKVVFDTNILISALALPGGQADRAMARIIDGIDELVISKVMIDELLEVLARKFSRDANELARVAVFLTDLATVAKPRRKLQILDDEPDNRILECALAGRAEAIVTGDSAMLKLKTFRDVRVISLRDYVDLV